MKGRSLDLLIFSAFAGLIVVCAAVLFYFNRGQRVPAPLSEYSTYRSDEEGAAAFYKLLNELGYNVQRLEQIADENGRERILFKLNAGLFHMDMEVEKDVLLKRVENGLVLIIADYGSNPLFLKTGAFISLSSALEGEITPAEPSVYNTGVSRVTSPGWKYFKQLGEGCPIMAARDKPKVISVRRGQGEIIFFTDPYPFSNKGIREADNAQLILNLVKYNAAPGKDDIVAFDEYHHGFSKEKTILAFLKTRNLQYAILQMIAVALLAVWAFGKRLGDPVPRPDSEAVKVREAAEYAEALAHLSRKAGLTDHVFKIIFTEYRHWLTRKLGLPPQAPRERIGEALREQKNPNTSRILSLIAESENIIRTTGIDERDLLRLARRMEKGEG